VAIREESIRLGQLLEQAGVVEDGEVTVDGKVGGGAAARPGPGMTMRYAGQLVQVTATG
jgi:ribosome-associated protein YbcJ (S4-like RNA binding protein)